MQRVVCVVAGILLFGTIAAAQEQSKVPQPAGVECPLCTAQPGTLAFHIQATYTELKMNLTLAAGKLPAAEYNTMVGTWSSERKMADEVTYGELFAVLAHDQFQSCAQAKGVPNPKEGINFTETFRTKVEVVSIFQESFAFCDSAYAALSDSTLLQPVKGGKRTIGATLMQLIFHSNHHGWETVWGDRKHGR